MSTFKPGDRVVLTDDYSDRLTKGSRHVVSSVSGDRVMLEGMAGYYWARRFEVEPEFVVGQQVSGDDYERLPIGASAEDADGVAITKAGGDPILWKTDAGKICWPLHPRTLTHLPDATEPEDKADPYVEPEPLKEGDWVQAWVQVDNPRVNDDGNIRVAIPRVNRFWLMANIQPDAIVRPDAGQVPPWIKPAQCTSLWEASPNDYARCIKDEHDDAEQHNYPGVFWTTAEEYGRVEVSS